jgi:hypothetical protein
MTKQPAPAEFIFNGSEKFTSRPATMNGVDGNFWVKRILRDGAWLHVGLIHVPEGASETEVMDAFDLQEN